MVHSHHVVALKEGIVPRWAAYEQSLRHAFSSRRPLVPWRNHGVVPPEEYEAIWADILRAEPATGSRLMYVHVPFCANHCLFCGFYRNRFKAEHSAAYTQLVCEELIREAGRPQVGSVPIHAVYFGGGTPTALDAEDLYRLICTIRERFPLANDCEFTVEGRMSHFTDEKIEACLEAGANRFSLGLQSFDTTVRKKQGRRSTREEAVAYLEKLIARDRATVVVDLMLGLPFQTDAVWERDLDTVLQLAPDGVDLYTLAVFPGTPLHRALAQGSMPAGAARDELGLYYAAGVERLLDAGWTQISNSHFARTTRERNRYNLLMKEGAETLAFGSGAGGNLGGYSFQRNGDLEAWTGAVEAQKPALSGLYRADALEPVRALITGQLERGRLDLATLLGSEELACAERVSTEPTREILIETMHQQLQTWSGQGLLELRGLRAELSVSGRFWSTNLRNELITLLEQTMPGAIQQENV